MVVQYEVKPH